MRATVEKLLRGSPVSPASHPLLVSLLEMAAAGPGIAGTGLEVAAQRKRLLRDWERVCEAFRACVAAKVEDGDVEACAPFAWLLLAPGGVCGVISGAPPLSYRALVWAALEKVVRHKAGKELQVLPIASVSDLRKAQKVNGCLSLSAPVFGRAGLVETPLLEGRRLVVSWRIFGLRCFFLLQADEHGAVSALEVYAGPRKVALELLTSSAS